VLGQPTSGWRRLGADLRPVPRPAAHGVFALHVGQIVRLVEPWTAAA